MNFKILSFFLVLILNTSMLFPQNEEVQKLISKSKKLTGEEKILAYTEICRNLYNINPQKGIMYGQLGLKLADSIKTPQLKGALYDNIGINYWALSDFETALAHFRTAYSYAVKYKDSLLIAKTYGHNGLIQEVKGNYDSCLIIFNKEIELYKEMNRKEEIGRSLENIGTIHMHRGEFKSAISNFLDAKNIYEEFNNTKALPYIYLKLGNIYIETGNLVEAEKWLKLGIESSKAINDIIKLGVGLNALGIVYQTQKKYDEALIKYFQALDAIKDINPKYVVMQVYSNIGNVYRLQKKFDVAKMYQEKALKLAIELNIPASIASDYVNLGEIYYAQEDYESAKANYEKALPIFVSLKDQLNLLPTYEALIKANNQLGDYEESVKYYELYTLLKDTLYKNEMSTALDSLKVQFETEQVKLENRNLIQEKKLIDKKYLVQRIILFSSFLVIILFIVVVWMIIRSRKKTKLTNEQLENKNLEISKQAEDLKNTNIKLTELSEFKDAMNSFLIHDLKIPLNNIINIDTKHPSNQQCAHVKHNGKQMLNLVLNLLDVSKYERKSMKIFPQEVSLNQVLKNAIGDVQYMADQKSIKFEIELQKDIIVNLDTDIMKRVFVNLFSNAIKFSPNGEIIKVWADHNYDGQLKIYVKDKGKGIEEKFLPIIFERFNQINEKKSGIGRSTGIGLSFCKMAVEAHQGEIGVNSKVGEGSTFWLIIPIHEKKNTISLGKVSKIDINSCDNKLKFSNEEVELIRPFCIQLKELSIHQISDVKDIINKIEKAGYENIQTWKTRLLQALSDCNEVEYNKLINLTANE